MHPPRSCHKTGSMRYISFGTGCRHAHRAAVPIICSKMPPAQHKMAQHAPVRCPIQLPITAGTAASLNIHKPPGTTSSR